MTNHVHRCIANAVTAPATGSTATADVVLLTIVDDERSRNRFAAAHRSQLVVAVELGVQGSIVEFGLVGFLHQELGRVDAVIHHRRSSIDDVRSAVAQFFVFDVRSQGAVLVQGGTNVFVLIF